MSGHLHALPHRLYVDRNDSEPNGRGTPAGSAIQILSSVLQVNHEPSDKWTKLVWMFG
jgi:hypothetical protein